MRSNLNIMIAVSIAFAAASSTARADNKAPPKPPVLRVEAQSMSDLGQKLQLTLQEANNIYTRSTKAQSDVSKSQSDTSNAIIKHLN